MYLIFNFLIASFLFLKYVSNFYLRKS